MERPWLDDWLEVWVHHIAAGDPETGGALMESLLGRMTEDAEWYDMPTGSSAKGHVQIRAWLGEAYRMCPGTTHVALSHQMGDGQFAMEWEWSGAGTQDMAGNPGAGSAFALRGASIGAFGSDGRVRLMRDYWNLADLAGGPSA